MITFKQYIFKNKQTPLLEMRDFSLKYGHWFELIKMASYKFNKYEKGFIDWLKNGKGKKWFLNTYQPKYPNQDASSILAKVMVKYWNEALQDQIKNIPNHHSLSRTDRDDEKVYSRSKKLFVDELYQGFKVENRQQEIKAIIRKNNTTDWVM